MFGLNRWQGDHEALELVMTAPCVTVNFYMGKYAKIQQSQQEWVPERNATMEPAAAHTSTSERKSDDLALAGMRKLDRALQQ